MNIKQPDIAKCREIINEFKSQGVDLTLNDWEMKVLEARLVKYAGDKENVFTSNVDNEESLIILAMLAGLDTKEKALEFLSLEVKNSICSNSKSLNPLEF